MALAARIAGSGVLALAAGLASCAGPAPDPHWVELWQIQDQREPAWDTLVAGMHEGSDAVRLRAARATGALGAAGAIGATERPRLVAELARLIADPQAWVRHEATFALGQLGGSEAANALRPRLDSAEAGVRYLAVSGLGKNGDAGALDLVRARLEDPEPQVRGAAALALVRLAGDRLRGAARIDDVRAAELARALVAAIAKETEVRARWRMVYALAHLGSEDARATLLEIVQQKAETGDARWEKVFALRGLAALAPTPATEAVLVRALDSEDWAIVYEAVAALCSPARQVDPARRAAKTPLYRDDALLARLAALAKHHRSAHVRALIANEIGRYGGGEAGYVAIIDALAGGEPNLRAAAIQGLARNRGATLDDATLSWLSGAAIDRDFRVRAGVARACAHVAGPVGLTLLATLAGDRDTRVATAALQALASRKADPLAVPIAAAALRVRDLAVREEAAPAAKTLARPELLDPLVDAYRDSPGLAFAESRKLLVEAAASLGEGARPLLDEALRDPDVVVRREAAARLRSLGVAVADDAVGRARELLTPRLGTDIPFEFLGKRPRVVVTTTKGEFTISLVPELAPIHCWNFLNLIARGDYAGRIFHRVVPNFVVQGGDSRGDGSGGTAWHGGQLRDEINPLPFEAGVVGMPKTADPDTGGEQIFITTAPTPHLDGRYTAFGKVVRGMDVVESLEVGDVIEKLVVQFD